MYNQQGQYAEKSLQSPPSIRLWDPHVPHMNSSVPRGTLPSWGWSGGCVRAAQFAEPKLSQLPSARPAPEAAALLPQIQAVHPQRGRKPPLPQKCSPHEVHQLHQLSGPTPPQTPRPHPRAEMHLRGSPFLVGFTSNTLWDCYCSL